MRKAIAAGALVACLACLAVPAFGGDAETSANRNVTVGDDFFKPRGITVNRNDTVTWTWKGRDRHNIRFSRKLGRPRGCGPIEGTRTGRCRRAFRGAGRFGYRCALHDSMTGRVTVR